MSTKIYDAYKIKTKGDPWKVIWDIEGKARANVDLILKALLLGTMRMLRDSPTAFEEMFGLKSDSRHYKHFLETSKKSWYDYASVSWDALTKAFQDQAFKFERNGFNFEVQLAVCPLDNQLYIKAYCDTLMRNVFKFLDTHPKVVDFHYQNQTDWPEHIPRQAWDHRKRTWDRIMKQDGRLRHVLLEVCSPSNFFTFNPLFELEGEFAQQLRSFEVPKPVAPVESVVETPPVRKATKKPSTRKKKS